MNKLTIDDDKFKGLVSKICRDITVSGWRPDYIVGINRGGLYPAVMISHYFNIPCESLKVKLRDHVETESNLWMAEDAFGKPLPELEVENDLASILEGASELLEMGVGQDWKNILIVDDINDTGATLNWIMQDWESGCHPGDPGWEHVWNQNVKFAVIVDNLASDCKVKMDFVGMEVNKAEKDVWIEFPYEEWWTK